MQTGIHCAVALHIGFGERLSRPYSYCAPGGCDYALIDYRRPRPFDTFAHSKAAGAGRRKDA
jgi:hypothetical protein